jgi:RimJ/RimL family protein N-acetyltransferase
MKGERIVLKRLRVTDVTQRYVYWLNDSRVNCFLSRGSVH